MQPLLKFGIQAPGCLCIKIRDVHIIHIIHI